MSDGTESHKKSALARFGELGPAWITAIAALIVALTGAGFFVGHVTASSPKHDRPYVGYRRSGTVEFFGICHIEWHATGII